MVCLYIKQSQHTSNMHLLYTAFVFFLYKILVIDNNKTFLIISEDNFLSNVILPT